MSETERQKFVHPELAGKKVIFDLHGQVRSVEKVKPKLDYNSLTPFREVNWLLKVLTESSDNL